MIKPFFTKTKVGFLRLVAVVPDIVHGLGLLTEQSFKGFNPISIRYIHPYLSLEIGPRLTITVAPGIWWRPQLSKCPSFPEQTDIALAFNCPRLFIKSSPHRGHV